MEFVAFLTYDDPKFISVLFVDWANSHAIIIDHIKPGSSFQNGIVERFNRTCREDALDLYLCASFEK